LIVFLVAFKAMSGAKTFMSQANWSKRGAGCAGLSAAFGATKAAGSPH
jgi:hypothetical protein